MQERESSAEENFFGVSAMMDLVFYSLIPNVPCYSVVVINSFFHRFHPRPLRRAMSLEK